MQDALVVERIRRKFKSLRPRLDERLRRQWAAAEAIALGWGGISAVVAATGLSHNTIDRGIEELGKPAPRISAGGLRRVPSIRRIMQDDIHRFGFLSDDNVAGKNQSRNT